MDKTITLRISGEMKRALEHICEREEKSVSAIVRAALRRLIAIHQFEALRAKVLPYAEKAVTVFDDEVSE